MKNKRLTARSGSGGPWTPPEAADLAERIAAASAPYEFRSFVIGFARPADYSREAHEARFRALKIEAGDELLRRWPGRSVEFDRPELRFNVREDLSILVEPAPLFLAGRYRKLSRQIPATRWIHHRCRGRGCPGCDFTGNLCGPSIQEMLEGPVLAASGGESTLFHGLGREDTDARMLGEGRPFVLEVFSPRRRSLDLEAILREVSARAQGLAEVRRLSPADRDAARAVKSAAAEKTYRALVAAEGALPEDAAARAASLAGTAIRQLSPRRVADRRGADNVRERRILESRWLGPFEGGHLWEIRTEAGAYVKEIISGDAGRTRPSLSEVLGVSCRCEALDVLAVHWDPPWEAPASGERSPTP